MRLFSFEFGGAGRDLWRIRSALSTRSLSIYFVAGLMVLGGCASTPPGITSHIVTTTDTRLAITLAAADMLGTPYQAGATGPAAFGDNGLVQYAYRRVGITLPSAPHGLLGSGVSIPMEKAAPGDLVFYQMHVAGGADSLRVGLYLNNREMIFASADNGKIIIQPIGSAYWRDRLLSVVKILP